MPIAWVPIVDFHNGGARNSVPASKLTHLGGAIQLFQDVLYIFEVTAERRATGFFYVQTQGLEGLFRVDVGNIGGHRDGCDTTIVAFSLMQMQGQGHSQ